MRSSAGDFIRCCTLGYEGRLPLIERLLPRVTLLTPNSIECAALLGEPLAVDAVERVRQAAALRAWGLSVLLKGGHADGATCDDVLIERDGGSTWFNGLRLAGSQRGTGCALAGVPQRGRSMKPYKLSWGLYSHRVGIYLAEKGITSVECIEFDLAEG